MAGMGHPGMMGGMADLADDPMISHIRDYGWVYIAAFVLLQFAGAGFLICEPSSIRSHSCLTTQPLIWSSPLPVLTTQARTEG